MFGPRILRRHISLSNALVWYIDCLRFTSTFLRRASVLLRGAPALFFVKHVPYGRCIERYKGRSVLILPIGLGWTLRGSPLDRLTRSDRAGLPCLFTTSPLHQPGPCLGFFLPTSPAPILALPAFLGYVHIVTWLGWETAGKVACSGAVGAWI